MRASVIGVHACQKQCLLGIIVSHVPCAITTASVNLALMGGAFLFSEILSNYTFNCVNKKHHCSPANVKISTAWIRSVVVVLMQNIFSLLS